MENDPSYRTKWYSKYKGGTVDGELSDEAFGTVRTDMREFYDEWVSERNREVMKRADIATAIGTCILALITGLSLGLKRAGNDITHGGGGVDGGKASGGAITFLGDNIYLVLGTIGGVAVYKAAKRR